MRDIKFISYDGKYPNLCNGRLVLKVDNEIKVFDNCLISGGSCGFKNNYEEEYILTGDWSIREEDFEVFSDEELEYITELVNENIEPGCCGGCL